VILRQAQTENPWRTLGSRRVYENPWISVREDSVVRPDGDPGRYGVVHYKNTAVGVLPVEDDHVYLVGQYRYPLDRYSWEIPEGGCPEGEEPLDAARRELREETGLEAKSWRRLGEAYLSNSVADELAVWYLATDLEPGEQRPEGTEVIGVRRVPLREAVAMAMDGRITDALSVLALTTYALDRYGVAMSRPSSSGGHSVTGAG
jgi:8-oxo-dGTP pyrophosphatase MutT (NUDIX family)